MQEIYEIIPSALRCLSYFSNITRRLIRKADLPYFVQILKL
jgi:hypothetical protein